MSGDTKDPRLDDVRRARRNAEITRRQLQSTTAALQARLKPATIANNAWEGVKDKSSDLAEDAVQAVKDRPLAASGAAAGAALLLARRPVWSLIRKIFRKKPDGDLVTTKLADQDPSYDLAAPTVSRDLNQGASA